MAKRWFLVGVMLLLVSLMMVGCGVPQEEHDAVLAERDAAQAELASLQSDLATTQSQLATTESDLTALKADLETAKADLETAKANLETANSKISTLQADLSTQKKNLAEIQKVYPPRDFSSKQELMVWLVSNDVSERAEVTTAENLYSKALEIQENALRDGYIVSVDLDSGEEPGVWYISCVTVIDGDIWAWNPETDDPINVSPLIEFAEVK